MKKIKINQYLKKFKIKKDEDVYILNVNFTKKILKKETFNLEIIKKINQIKIFVNLVKLFYKILITIII
jgi:hypothetical protein